MAAALLQLVWNHHPFAAASAPAAPRSNWLGTDAPTLAQALDQLCSVQPGAASQPVKHYTLAEVFGLTPEELASLQVA